MKSWIYLSPINVLEIGVDDLNSVEIGIWTNLEWMFGDGSVRIGLDSNSEERGSVGESSKNKCVSLSSINDVFPWR